MQPRKLAAILAVSAALAAYTAWLPAAHRLPPAVGPVGAEVPLVRPAQARELWERPSTLFVDVRPATDFVFGHVPGAINLPEPEIEARLPAVKDRLRQAETLVVYCKSTDCGLSLWAALRLRNEGLAQTVIYPEGWNDWFNRGMPVARDAER